MQTISNQRPLLLGSQSPRRRDILLGLGIPIVVRPASVDEATVRGERVHDYLERVVDAKLKAVASALTQMEAVGALVADTVVVVDGRILGKPGDEREAVELLEQLAGREHRVLTRFAIAAARAPALAVASNTVESRVIMRSATREELERYAATGEGLDKAGAYAVQGLGAFLVERIHGSYSNVIGLPACEVVVELGHAGLLDSFPMTPPS